MAYEVIRLFGACLTDLTAGLGWGSETGSIQIELVEDPKDPLANQFTRPRPGSPVYINIGSFSFGGIVQRWIQKHTRQGNPTYTVDIVDPREVLDSAKVIIGNYEGSTLGIPNLINAYGSYAWGVARVNDSGMPWVNIVPVLQASTLTFNGVNYRIDLSELPLAPVQYRIPGTFASILEMVEQVCSEGACEFFVKLELRDGEHFIVVKTQSITTQSPSAIGRIEQFINIHTDKKVEYSFGEELRNGTTSAILFGGEVQELYTTTAIRPFWGFLNGKPVVSAYEFALDISSMNMPILGQIYETDVNEMRAVLGGYNTWETYIALKKPNLAQVLGINNMEAYSIGQILDIPTTQVNFNRMKKFNKRRGQKLYNMFSFAVENYGEIRQQFFTALQNFAKDFYGRKFIVQIPDAHAYLDAIANEYVFDIEVTDAGWSESVAFGQDPIGINDDNEIFFKVQDGRFVAFVRIDGLNLIDISQLNNNDFLVQGTSIYVKCDVNSNIIQWSDLYENIYGQVDPRNGVDPGNISTAVIITLPAGIGTILRDSNTQTYEFDPQFGFLNLLYNILLEQGNPADIAREKIQKLIADSAFVGLTGFGAAPTQLIPSAAAIPLRSKVNLYGPWYAHIEGSSGRVEVLEDASLTPWEYGGVGAMNISGTDRVVRAANALQTVETGTITLEGLPIRNIGDILISEGPVVTRIDITYATGGITTIYRCQTYTPQFGDFGKNRSDRLKRLGLLMNQTSSYLKRAARPQGQFGEIYYRGTLSAKTPWGGFFDQAPLVNLPPADTLYGRFGSNNVALLNSDTALNTSNVGNEEEFAKTGGSSINSMFRVISTKTNDRYFPHFIEASGGQFPTVSDLNPFKSGHDMFILSGQGGSLEGDFKDDYDSTNARPIGLRGPVTIAGWGYDINGNPVPNADPNYPSSSSNTHASGYLTNVADWKCGPLDARWDESRGVWVAGGVSTRLAVVIAHSGHFPSGYTIEGTNRFYGPPRYVCRDIYGFDDYQRVRIITPWYNQVPPFPSGNQIPSGVSITDTFVVNLAEATNDVHTIGLGSTVVLYTYGNVTCMNERPSTLMHRNYGQLS